MRTSIESLATRIPTLGLLFFVVMLAAAALGGPDRDDEMDGMLDRSRYAVLGSERLNYVCREGDIFTLIVSASGEFIWFVDGANGLTFNLYSQPLSRGQHYSDGAIDITVAGEMATVLVDDAVRYGNCELRTRYYDCPAGTFFGLETLGVAEEQAIIEDGTNRKMFTLDRMDSAGLMYGDGVILVDRTGPAANVYVDGLIRFANCTLRPV